MHTGSRPENANGDFLARLPPPQYVQETRMRQWVERHATLENRTMPTPFLSVTTELLRALNFAEHFRMRGYNDIRIVLIDGWSLSRNASTAVNPLQRRLGLNKAGTSTCERYIWARILNTSSWNNALNLRETRFSNWGWKIQHLDRHLFSRCLDEIAPVLGITTLAHSLYSSFDHWWYGREEAEMVFWVEGRQDECVDNGTSYQWFNLSHRTSRS